jgi:hypothetical protein
MDINGIIMLPKKITSSVNLTDEFRELFSSAEAKEESIVYFFKSLKPVPRIKGQSDILYIGQSEKSLHSRYFPYARKLASNRNGDFYAYIIKEFGGISLGYVKTDTPTLTEKEYFNEYRKAYVENPPKSKVG